MTKRFTGWHMLAILVAGFGIVIAVNFTMAYYASSTFGGTVVDNSYVASQQYNDWLDEARTQDELGWHETFTREGEELVIAIESPLGPLADAEISGMASHPLGRAEPVALEFAPTGPGRYRSLTPLPQGRWQLRIEIVRGGERKRLIEDLS